MLDNPLAFQRQSIFVQSSNVPTHARASLAPFFNRLSVVSSGSSESAGRESSGALVPSPTLNKSVHADSDKQSTAPPSDDEVTLTENGKIMLSLKLFLGAESGAENTVESGADNTAESAIESAAESTAESGVDNTAESAVENTAESLTEFEEPVSQYFLPYSF